MPKILINEIDKTLPGTPNDYANYSVLIPGFFARTPVLTADVLEAKKQDPESTLKADKVQPDSNGIYEFSSYQDFIDVIGLVAPKAVVTTADEDETTMELFHYGNQMAYELLKQGYTVIYMPITPKTCVSTLTNANTWDIFKDKANYDFRFVVHGLLESSDTSALEAQKDTINKALRVLDSKSVIEYDEATFTVTLDGQNIDSLSDADLDRDSEANNNVEATFESESNYSKYYLNELSTGLAGAEADGLRDTNGEYYTLGGKAAKALINRMRSINELLAAFVTTNTINTANANIANLAKYTAAGSGDNTYNDFDKREPYGRGDCVALIEMDEKTYAGSRSNPELAIIKANRKMSDINSTNGKYCALTVPSVVYTMTDDERFDNNKKFPGCFHYLTCFMSALRTGFAEWYAAAGYTRGVSSYKIDYTTVTLGEVAINALEPRKSENSDSEPSFACNVIANFRGSYYLWGNRTAHPLENKDLVASHFLNIRQLCTTIKKQLYVACRRFTFDPNSDTLWFNFVNAIRPTLEVMKADQGIRDYKIMKVYDDRKATFKAKIRIIPIEAVEDFDLEVSLEDSFGETAAVVTE